MDFKQLEYFIKIVEEGSISAAAKKLFMSQPPLSFQMKLLEKELGTLLFERGPRNIILTEAGKVLYERAKTLIRLNNFAKEEIEEIKEGNKGLIRLGVVSSVMDYFLSSILEAFWKKYPNIRFEIFEDNTYNLLNKLEKNEIELAIVRTPFDTMFKILDITTEQLFAVGNPKYFKSESETSLKEIMNLPFAVYRRWEAILKSSISQKKLLYEPSLVSDDARTSLAFATNNLGVSIVPESIIKSNKIKKNNVREIKDLNISSKISLVYNDDAYISKVMRCFIDFIK